MLKFLAQCHQSQQQKFLLAECVPTYLKLERLEEQAAFEKLLRRDEFREVPTMATTWYEQGLQAGLEQGLVLGLEKGRKEGLEEGREEGREKGRQEGREEGRGLGQKQLVLRLLDRRFGPLPQAARDAVEQASIERIAELAEQLLTAQSLEELGLVGER